MLLVSTSMLHNEQGPTQMLAAVQDITERKQMEWELRESQQKLAGVLDAVADNVSMINEEHTIKWANRVAKEKFGPDLLGKKCYRVYHGSDMPCESCLAAQTFADGRPHEHETRSGGAQGEKAYWCTTSVAARDGDGQPRLVVEVSRDVTERKRAEEQSRKHLADLSHVARLATMGEMASGLAHEINQPLTAIASYAGVCFNKLEGLCPPETETLRDLVTRIEQQALRAGRIIRRLRSLITGRAPVRVSCDVNRLVTETLDLIDAELKQQQIVRTVDLTAGLPPISADPIQIQQVVMNLLFNAVDAVSAGNGSPRTLGISTATAAADQLAVSIRDSGPGISAAEADRIFDAFFTTKPGGMGMGLAISRSIVEAHGGRLQMTPNPDRGCTFRFTVPRAVEEPA
jgi:PAS domain S-box-containing protein